MAPSEPADPKRDELRHSGALHPAPEHVTDRLFVSNEFFDARDVLQVKYEMLRQVRVDGATVSAAAEAFGFSRPAYYDAHAAFERAGIAGFLPKKRGPKGARKLLPEVMAFVGEQLELEPHLSAATLVERVHARFDLRVHERSIERALARARPRKKRR